jgi:tetrahydromethanopterin S-methyltransferase subunit B
MYKVTAYFKDHKVTRKFYDLYDAIDYRDSADAYYPIKVTFEKVKDMREWVYECWNAVMDDKRNPLSNIPDFSTRHMIMQVLAWMWCITFAFIVGSMWAGVVSMMIHVVLLGAIAVTVATFETAKRKPQFFVRDNRINSRAPGGEHE